VLKPSSRYDELTNQRQSAVEYDLMTREIAIQIVDLLGTAAPFKQGGSLRITLPKKMARAYTSKSPKEVLEDVTFFFIRTNMGVLMCTLADLSRNVSLKEVIVS